MKTEIPQWVIEYNNAAHQSSAGRALKITMSEIVSLRTENANLKLAVTKTLELLEGNPTWTIDELHEYLKSVSE